MTGPFQEHDVGEIPVWQHSEHDLIHGVNLSKIASNPMVKKTRIAFYLLFGLGALFWFTRPSVLEYVVSVRFFLEIVTWGILFYVGPKITAGLTRVFEKDRKPEITAIPLWMSQERLAYSSSDKIIDETLNLGDVLSAYPDFAEGAPALSLSLRDRKIILMSSEINSLKKHIYTLRPDLEPTS